MGKYGTAGPVTVSEILRRMRFACWIPKATNTHSEYVVPYCFSSSVMVTQTRPTVAFVHTLRVLFELRTGVNEKVCCRQQTTATLTLTR